VCETLSCHRCTSGVCENSPEGFAHKRGKVKESIAHVLVINQQTGVTHILFSTQEINYKCLHNFVFDFICIL